MNKILTAAFLVLFTLPGLAQSADKPLLVATIKPLALIAGDLAGDWLRVETLLPPGQEPHHVSLGFAQRRMIADADLVIWVGPELETFLVRLLGRDNGIATLSFQDAVADSAAALRPGDAHYWLHPGLAADFYRALASTLVALFPAREAEIRQRLDTSLSALTTASQALREQLEEQSRRRLLAEHQAWGYFADYFGLDIAGSLSDESGVTAGPRSLAALSRHGGAACLVVETLPAGRLAQRTAERLGIEVVAVDPLGTDVDSASGYIGLLASLVSGFQRCLSAAP